MISSILLIYSGIGLAVRGNDELTESVVFASKTKQYCELVKTKTELLKFVIKNVHEKKDILRFLTEQLSYLNSTYKKKSDPLILQQILYLSETIIEILNLTNIHKEKL